MDNETKHEGALEVLAKLTRPVMVKTDPLKRTWVPRDGETAPTYGWGRWCRRGDGTYVFVPLAGRWLQLTPEFMEALGFAMTFKEFMRTLRNLARAGMIEMAQVTPRIALINVESLFAHLEKGARDIDWLETGTLARRAYQFKNGEKVGE